MERDPRIGVVGLGEMGEWFIDITLDHGCEVAATDADPSARDEIARTTGVETYQNYPDMYDDVDAVIIATPNKYHERPATDAFEAGLDVYIEKPLAHEYESARRIVEASREADGIGMTSYHYPSFPLSKYLKSRIDEGFFGDVVHVEARHVFRRHVPHPGSWYTSKEIAGGGALLDKGSFVLDMLYYFGLADVDAVVATARTNFGDREEYTSHRENWGEPGHEDIFDVEDSLSGFLTFEDGVTATLEVAWAANTEHEHSYRIRGTDGGAYLNIPDVELRFYDVLRESSGALFDLDATFLSEEEIPVGSDSSEPDGFSNSAAVPETSDDFEGIDFPRMSLSTFIECVRTREEPDHGDLERALRVQQAIDRIYREVDV